MGPLMLAEEWEGKNHTEYVVNLSQNVYIYLHVYILLDKSFIGGSRCLNSEGKKKDT